MSEEPALLLDFDLRLGLTTFLLKAESTRSVVDALQQDAKLGKGDEVAVLQRERKKRAEAAEAFEGAGRTDQAAAERFEADLISVYLPAELSDEELDGLVAEVLVRYVLPEWRKQSSPACRLRGPPRVRPRALRS